MSEKKEYIERSVLLKQFDEALLTGMAQRAHASGVSEEAIKAALDKTRVVSEIVIECINAILAADVEPVVRCGNCEHSAINEYADDIDESPYYCFHLDCGVETNAYCSSGKTRTHMERSGSGE